MTHVLHCVALCDVFIIPYHMMTWHVMQSDALLTWHLLQSVVAECCCRVLLQSVVAVNAFSITSYHIMTWHDVHMWHDVTRFAVSMIWYLIVTWYVSHDVTCVTCEVSCEVFVGWNGLLSNIALYHTTMRHLRRRRTCCWQLIDVYTRAICIHVRWNVLLSITTWYECVAL